SRQGAGRDRAGCDLEGRRREDRRPFLRRRERGDDSAGHPRYRSRVGRPDRREAVRDAEAALRPVCADRGRMLGARAHDEVERAVLQDVSVGGPVRTLIGQLIVAALILAAGEAFRRAAHIEQQLALAEADLATLAPDAADADYGEVEQELGLAGRLPF